MYYMKQWFYIFYGNRILSTAVLTQNIRCTMTPKMNNTNAFNQKGCPSINDNMNAQNNTTKESNMAMLNILYLRIPVRCPGSPNKFLYFAKKGKGHVLFVEPPFKYITIK